MTSPTTSLGSGDVLYVVADDLATDDGETFVRAVEEFLRKHALFHDYCEQQEASI
jgi:hypothetical protein